MKASLKFSLALTLFSFNKSRPGCHWFAPERIGVHLSIESVTLAMLLLDPFAHHIHASTDNGLTCEIMKAIKSFLQLSRDTLEQLGNYA